ncbi:MAG: hypothetical protein ABIH03_08720 [Pseudomonadota bacterium]
MAVILQLVCGALTTLDLNAAAGAGFRASAWNQAIATPTYGGDPPPVAETMDLILESTNHDDMASDMQHLHAYAVQADAYRRDRTVQDPVWLQCKMANETGTRQALVLRIDGDFRLPLYTLGCEAGVSKTRVRVQITRGPYWEATTAAATAAASPAATAVVTHDYTAGLTDPPGDVPARLAPLWINSANVTSIPRLWMGFRSYDRHGSLNDFEPLWEIEDAGIVTAGGADLSAAQADATASGGNRRDVSFATQAGWYKRFDVSLTAYSTNEEANYGTFLWLLRACNSDASTSCDVQLRFGGAQYADAQMVQGPIVTIPAAQTDWEWYELGVKPYPLVRDLHAFPLALLDEDTDRLDTVRFMARRTAGAANLKLDCLVRIPVDEGFASVKQAAMTADAGVYIAETPEMYPSAESYHSTTGYTWWRPELRANGFRPPVGDGRLIVAYGRASSTVITDAITFAAGGWIPRWLSLRGADAWAT